MEGLTLLPLMVVLPLAGAFVSTLVGNRGRTVAPAIACTVMGVLVVGAVALFGQSGTYRVGGWATPYGIDLHADDLTALVSLLVAGVSLMAAVYSTGYLREDSGRGRYYALFMLMVAGMNGVVGAGDLFNLYVFVEVTSMAAYALIAFEGRAENFEASFKYAVLGGIASTLILLGIGALYSVTGTLNMAHLAERIADPSVTTTGGAIVALATALLLSGFAFKAALVPFHAWLPDAYPAAPAPISAVLAGVLSKVLGVYVLARLVFNILPPDETVLALLRLVGVASMVVGGLGALGQRDAKRLFAYSSIEQSGYLVLALGLGTQLGVVAAVFHMVNHAAFKSLLFFNVGTVERSIGTRDLSKIGGLARTMPVLSATSLIGALSNAGLPPFGGFWSKLLIIVACLHADMPYLAVAAALVSVITLAFQLKVQHEMFFGPGPDLPRPRRVPWAMLIPSWTLAVVCASLGLLCLGGLHRPLVVGAAADALTQGRFTMDRTGVGAPVHRAGEER